MIHTAMLLAISCAVNGQTIPDNAPRTAEPAAIRPHDPAQDVPQRPRRAPSRAQPASASDSPDVSPRSRASGDKEVDPNARAVTIPIASMRAVHLYSSAKGPLEISIRRGDENESLTLMLIDPAGEVLGMGAAIPGRIDLMQVIPGIASLQRAAWLQLVKDDQPLGSPMVVQPVREPPPVRTMRTTRPGGTAAFTKIIGWGNQPLDADDPTIDEAQKTWIPGDAPIISGFKIYPEMDILIRTDHGEILVALAPDEAPNTVWNFRTLARDGFYNHGGFHRIVPADREGRPFVIQGGDPTLTGNGGPGFALTLEPSSLEHDYGVISMARGDEPHSAGSQFFFALGREATARLDGQYCAFGYAVSGARAIDSIAATPIANLAEGRPVKIPVILSMQLVPSPARMPGIDRRSDRIKPLAKAGEAPATAR